MCYNSVEGDIVVYKGSNNVIYYKYDINIKTNVETYFKKINQYNFGNIDKLENVEKILDDFFNIYNQFNKFGITMNKLDNYEEIEYCDKIYSNFELIKNIIIVQILKKFSISELKESKYYYFLKRGKSEIPSTDLMNRIYLEFCKLTSPSEMSFKKVIEYINSREENVKKSGYNSYLEYIKEKVGISEESYSKILNVETLSNSISKPNDNCYYKLKDAKNILIEILKNHYDAEILKILLDNTYISNKRSGTTVAYGELPIINISGENDRINIIVLAHELGHAYHYYCNQKNEIQNFDSRSDFSESFAIATQMIVSNKMGFNDNIINDYHNFFADTIYSLKIQNFIEENYSTLKEPVLAEKFNDYKEYYRFILDNFYDIYYLEGFVIGNILENKIERYTIAELKTLLSFNSNISLNEILKSFDIDLNDQDMLDSYLYSINQKYKQLIEKNKNK